LEDSDWLARLASVTKLGAADGQSKMLIKTYVFLCDLLSDWLVGGHAHIR
jgi:hypothetical protein